ncbi:Adhesion G protein-coupled receptor L3 [Holothuria leucospilota]|uniref:Adhesion G protein-coupled receptor L3 n=1 Tax=Holothuria leucospilota TaxID=206669 RepID=A0A9Q1CCT9_HOLLE|nr:Adhesion G protein-coupled receptor L3 [Holothuria leucospilota]
MSNFKWIFVWMVFCSISGVFGGTVFVQTSHNFTSENFPSDYPSNRTTTWNFETVPNQRLLLRFLHISTERIFDVISVGDGSFPSSYSRLLRCSGKDRDQKLAVLSTGNRLWVTLQADTSLDESGFTAMVERVSAERIQDISNCTFRCGDRVCLTKNDICDGLINCEDGADENCTDTVFVDSVRELGSLVGYDQFPDNFRFTWYFETTPGFQLLLEFDSINSEVYRDFVIIGEGHNVSSNHLLTWSGDSKGNMVQVVSGNNFMWMVLSTDVSNPVLHFNGHISKRNVTQEGWQCASNSFNCSEKVCIPYNNKCDYNIQCPDGEDERGCQHGVDDEVCNHNLVCSEKECLSRKCNDNADQCRKPKYGCSGVVPDGKPYNVQWGNFSYTYNISANKPGHRLVLSFQLFTREYEAFSLKIDEGEETSELLSLKGIQAPSYVITVHSLRDTMRLSFTTEGGLFLKVDEIATTEGEIDCGTLNTFQCSPGVCIPRDLVKDGRENCVNGMDEATTQTTTEATLEESRTPSFVDKELERITEKNITDDNVQEIAQDLEKVSGQADNVDAENVETIIGSIEDIVQFNASAEQVINITDSVVAISNNIVEVSSETLNNVTDLARVPLLLEEQAATLHLNGKNYSNFQENLGVSAIQIHESTIKSNVTFGIFATGPDLEDENFRLSESNTGFRESFAHKQPRAAISLPRYILESIEKGKQNLSTVPLSFLVYRDDTLFPVNTNLSTAKASRGVISSHVISATVAVQNVTVSNLPNDSLVILEFYSPKVVDDNETELTRQCVFWKYDPAVALGEWSTEGCNEVTNQSTDTQLVCACNHLTSFAVFVRIGRSEYDPPSQFFEIVTKIGCILSVAGLCLCIVTILTIRPTKSDKRARQQACIHLNLCIALLGLYLIFLIGIDRTQESLGCRLIASFIHFFCLSSMSWMSVEAFNMFMLFWKMRQTEIKYLTPMAIALAWGVYRCLWQCLCSSWTIQR